MTVESVLVAKNRDQFDKIVSFMRSLIFKNQVEADEAETTDTLNAYERYEAAYLLHDSSLSYQLTKESLINFGFSESSAIKYVNDPRSFQSAVMAGNTVCKAYLNSLRKIRVSEYIENNSYYRQFCGLPYDKSQYIGIMNTDKINDTDPDTIWLHEVTLAKYPLTYARLFYERDIEAVYADHNYLYLQFLEKPMTPYEIRTKEQLDICYYDQSVLSGSELQYWFECYEKARNEIMLNDYVEAFETTYKAYTNVMLISILSLAFNLYCSKMLERFAVRDFTDSEIYDIIESNDLSELKSLDISLLRRIVDKLPDLKAYTGTDKVIDIIYDIVADSSINVKRYYLKKKYNVDAQGNTDVDKNQLYNKSVDIVFEEKTIKRGTSSTDNLDQEYPYDSVVMSDDTWGATHEISNEKQKLEIKEEIKRELLKANFSTVMTKYISVSKIIDLNVKMIDLSNKLGLLYQYCDAKGNKISSDKVVFEGIETNALSLYAAWCVVFGAMNGLTDPDRIPVDSTLIEGVMKLRTVDKLSIDVLNVKNLVIDVGKGSYSERHRLINTSENDKLLEEVISENNIRIMNRHPLFSHYSLNKTSLNPIEYKLNACNSYIGIIENETLAYDSRQNLKRVERTTQTDSEGRKLVFDTIVEYGIASNKSRIERIDSLSDENFDSNNIVKTVTDAPILSENPDYRKAFKYDSYIKSILAVSGTRDVLKYNLRPTYSYILSELMDGQYAFDGNNLSGYVETTVWEDSEGRKRTEEKTYRYNLDSALPILFSTKSFQDEEFDISDPMLGKTYDKKDTNNPNFLKVYVFNNGEWNLAETAWVETTLKVDSNRNIIVPASSSVDVYALFKYAATVGDYLSDEEIEANLISFKNISSLTINDLYNDYDKNYEIIEAIKDKIATSYDFAEYQLWNTIYEANMACHTLNQLFEGSRNYSEYILNNSKEMYDYLDSKITMATTNEDLAVLEEKFHTAFANYIKTISLGNAEIYTNEADIAGGEDLSQIALLFRQFVSLYTQLYKSTYNISYDNAADNSLELLHAIVKDCKTSSSNEFIELVERIVGDLTTVSKDDWLVLEEYITDKVKVVVWEYLDLAEGYYKLNEFGNEVFVSDKYYKDLIGSIRNEFLNLVDIYHKDELRSISNEEIGFSDEVIGDKIR